MLFTIKSNTNILTEYLILSESLISIFFINSFVICPPC